MRAAFEAEFAPLALDINGSGSDTERGDDFKVTIVSDKFVGHGLCERVYLVNDLLDDHDLPYIHGQKLACLTERQLHHHFEQLRDGPQQLYPHALESDFLQRGGKLKARQLREQDKKLPEKEFPTPLEVLGDLIEPFPTAAMPEDSGDTAGVAAKKPEQTNPVKKMQALIPPRR